MLDFDRLQVQFKVFLKTHQLLRFQEQQGTIEKNLVITDHTLVKGEVYGDITVMEGRILILKGTLHGNLILLPASKAIIRSTIHGNVFGRDSHFEFKKRSRLVGNLIFGHLPQELSQEVSKQEKKLVTA